ALRARRHPLVPLALGAYATYLVHAAADWDWELVGVTVTALLVGAACILAGRADEASVPAISSRIRTGLAVALVAVSAFTIVSLLGNTAAGSSEAAARRGNYASAANHARTAIRWSPWS